MEVTRKNFKDALPLVKKSIDAADFLAIDSEFTGLMSGRDVSAFDSPAEYYRRLRDGAGDFLLIQFGLAAFRWDTDSGKYTNDAYNFYVYPRVRPGPDRVFLCQSSSLEFLATQGFDFNKLLAEGIPYLTEPAESMLREKLQERQKSYTNGQQQKPDIITIPQENKQQIDTIMARVKEFLEASEPATLEIDRCNAFIRKLVFQEVGLRFKEQAYVESLVQENSNRILKISRLSSSDESRDREEEKRRSEWEELEEAVGFSRVARLITESEKLVVGHNMLLDVLHTLNHFYQPLPEDYATFKEFAHCMLPRVLDTKYMSSLPPFKDKVGSSVLPHLLATLSEEPFAVPLVECAEGRGYGRAQDKSHEAGYDAYVTGLCFLAMHAHVARMRGDAPPAPAPAPAARVHADAPLLKPFLDKLYLSKTAHHDSPYMNLAGQDPTPSRDHVFHISFPTEWSRSDISQLFSPFGPVFVSFVDEASALVSLSRREQARAAARSLAQRAPRTVTVTPYQLHQAKTAVTVGAKQTHWLSKERLEAYRRRALVIASPSTATVDPTLTVTDDGVSSTTSGGGFIPLRAERERASAGAGGGGGGGGRKRRTSSASPGGAGDAGSAGGAAGGRKRTASSSGAFSVLEAEPHEACASPAAAAAAASPPLLERLDRARNKSEVAEKKRESPAETSESRPRKAEQRMKKHANRKSEDAEEEEVSPKKFKIAEKFESLDAAEARRASAFEESDNWD